MKVGYVSTVQWYEMNNNYLATAAISQSSVLTASDSYILKLDIAMYLRMSQEFSYMYGKLSYIILNCCRQLQTAQQTKNRWLLSSKHLWTDNYVLELIIDYNYEHAGHD